MEQETGQRSNYPGWQHQDLKPADRQEHFTKYNTEIQ